MSRMIKSIIAMLMMVGAAAGIAATSTSPAEAAATTWGCPSGYVCLYTEEGWWDDRPEHKYYKYGSHNFSNEYGYHYVFNNQTGGAKAVLNKGYNGTKPSFTLGAGSVSHVNMTPMNSITLKP